MFLSHFTLSFHFNVVLIVELDFSSPPAHKQPLFESKNLWSNVCYSDIEELLRYSTLYIKSFSTLRFNLFIRINYEIVFHQPVCFFLKVDFFSLTDLFALWYNNKCKHTKNMPFLYVHVYWNACLLCILSMHGHLVSWKIGIPSEEVT